jgi:hypothetical protein
MKRPCRWHFEVRLTLQTACPSRFAWCAGIAAQGTGTLSGSALEELERELGSLEAMRAIAREHELDVSLERVVIHPVDSYARDFASALLAVARTIRGLPPEVPYVRKLVVEPIG